MADDEQYTAPQLDSDAFNCPHCEAYASQEWKPLKINVTSRPRIPPDVEDAQLSRCQNCQNYHIWVGEEMIYPKQSTAPLPHGDMPDDVKTDYNEARQVVSDSPKAAAALLRRALEGLIEHLLDDPSDHLYTDIETLAEEGIIDDRIRKAFDIVRVSGNDYTHAGTIYAEDNRETALKLFELINIIVSTTLADEKLINELYDDIPDTKKRENNN